MSNLKSLYQLTDKEKEQLIKNLSQDITLSDDDLFDSEQDVSNEEEMESQDETDLF